MRRRGFVTFALGLASLASPLARAEPGQAQDIGRRLRFNLTFSNPHPYDLTDQVFACYLPADLGAVQRLHKVEASMAHRVETDALGHRILLLTFSQFPRFGQKVVTLNVEVHMEGVAGRAPAVEPGLQQWLGSERFIESDTAPIRTLAASLQERGEHQTVIRIYDWVRGNMKYAGFVPEDRGALDALKTRLGDCTEYAALVVALARAAGLPARMVGGHVVDRDLAPLSQDYHNWAEIYLDGAWRTVDAQKECLFSTPSQYIVFRIYRDVPTNAVGLAHRYRMQGALEVRM